jgi:hypothetical protein
MLRSVATTFVMAGLVPAIHALFTGQEKEDVDARHKAGHDDGRDVDNVA